MVYDYRDLSPENFLPKMREKMCFFNENLSFSNYGIYSDIAVWIAANSKELNLTIIADIQCSLVNNFVAETRSFESETVASSSNFHYVSLAA